MNVFIKDMDALNTQQQEAVHCINNNALVLAPAGTGKTKVIALRTAYLLNQQINPDRILNLTFTNKAAREMEKRIELYAPQHTKNLTIKTFHSFCYQLLNQEKHNTHFSFPCTIIDEADTKSILERIIRELIARGTPIENDDVKFDFIQFIENAKKHSLNFPLEQRKNYESIVKDYIIKENIKTPFLVNYGLRILKMYQNYIRTNNSLDFIDLIIETSNLLEDINVLEKWQQKYSYIQVDEMQDTSVREYAIIKKLAHKNNLTLYGDFNQTIYQWRGSNPMPMINDFIKSFNPIQIELKINYRSTQMLLDAANLYIRNSKLYPLECTSYSNDVGEHIEVLVAPYETSEYQAVAASIKNNLEEGSKSIAVLTRLNNQAKQMATICQQHDIPTLQVEDIRLFRKKEIRDIQAFFNYAINPRNSLALEQILKLRMFNIDEWLLKALKSSKKEHMQLHDWFLADHSDPYQNLFKAYRYNELVVLDVESTGLNILYDDIIQIAAIRYGIDGVKEQLNILVKPTKKVGNSYYIHGFTDEQLEAEGLDPNDALEQLIHFIKSYTLVGHNIHYDISIIESMLSRYEKPKLVNTVIYDTMDLARKIYPNLVNHKLETLAQHIQTDTIPNHDALQDILATSEILTHFIEQLTQSQSKRLEAIELYYSHIVHFKTKLQTLISEIVNEPIPMSIDYLLNSCGMIHDYHEEEQQNLRVYNQIAIQLYNKHQSIRDNIIHLLSFASLNASEVEQSQLFKDKLPIMTIHQAKGLEFDIVYIIGCNDGVFPHKRHLKSELLQEEHRLFYVGMTRPKKKLYLSYHTKKKASIFIDEIGESFKKYRKF